MKVLMINGSPNKQGSTYTGLCEMQRELHHAGIETELVSIGYDAFIGCNGCGACVQLGKCVHDDDLVNPCLEKMRAADGLVIGGPVHYAGINGGFKSFLDRFFYAGRGDDVFLLKPATTVASLRRSGGIAAYDGLNHYLSIKGMIIVSATYWSVIHGNHPDETIQDLEGMQIVRNAGRNMAYVLKKLKASPEIKKPTLDKGNTTNFIR
ncbi:MAG: flavodoxin family protein [Christensenellaceae bacterium]|jgi:multimeric flavodoxin WrbA